MLDGDVGLFQYGIAFCVVGLEDLGEEVRSVRVLCVLGGVGVGEGCIFRVCIGDVLSCGSVSDGRPLGSGDGAAYLQGG